MKKRFHDAILSIKNPFLFGTLLLTAGGLLTRVLGFFYRIWLAGVIGEVGMGIYQLVFPVFGVAFALCATAIQTSISRFTAEAMSQKNHHRCLLILQTGLACSLLLSLLCGIFIYRKADFLATHILNAPECAHLLPYIAVMLPLGAVHACIGGYYLGCKNAAISAASQLIEQCFRILCTYLALCYFLENSRPADAMLPIIGMTAGEIASFVFGGGALIVTLYKLKSCMPNLSFRGSLPEYKLCFQELSSMACPLMFNRVLLGLLQSGEAVLLPLMLQSSGLSSAEALGVYGVFSGMALPFLMFPSAITNSISAMLLPFVADANAAHQKKRLQKTVRKALFLSGGIGVFFFIIFLLFGKGIGLLVFDNATAGDYLLILSWICPFLYMNSTLGSTMNGLGLTTLLFVQNSICLSLRILSVLFLVPRFGMQGYLWGLLFSTILQTLLHSFSVQKRIPLHEKSVA